MTNQVTSVNTASIVGFSDFNLAPGVVIQREWSPVVRDAPISAREHDPTGADPHTPGAKLDAGKALPWLMVSGFSNALKEVADVTTKGARKYTPSGWESVPDGTTRYMDAFGRHMLALGTGEVLDTDTGCRHKAQMIWNLLASLELEIRASNGWRPPHG